MSIGLNGGNPDCGVGRVETIITVSLEEGCFCWCQFGRSIGCQPMCNIKSLWHLSPCEHMTKNSGQHGGKEQMPCEHMTKKFRQHGEKEHMRSHES